MELAELEAVVSLLAGPGMIQRLDFGGFILLRPEVLSRLRCRRGAEGAETSARAGLHPRG